MGFGSAPRHRAAPGGALPGRDVHPFERSAEGGGLREPARTSEQLLRSTSQHHGKQMLWFRHFPEYAVAPEGTTITSVAPDDQQTLWTANVPAKRLTESAYHNHRSSVPLSVMGDERVAVTRHKEMLHLIEQARRGAPDEAWADAPWPPQQSEITGDATWASAALPSQPGALARSLLQPEPGARQPRPAPRLHFERERAERVVGVGGEHHGSLADVTAALQQQPPRLHAKARAVANARADANARAVAHARTVANARARARLDDSRAAQDKKAPPHHQWAQRAQRGTPAPTTGAAGRSSGGPDAGQHRSAPSLQGLLGSSGDEDSDPHTHSSRSLNLPTRQPRTSPPPAAKRAPPPPPPHATPPGRADGMRPMTADALMAAARRAGSNVQQRRAGSNVQRPPKTPPTRLARETKAEHKQLEAFLLGEVRQALASSPVPKGGPRYGVVGPRDFFSTADVAAGTGLGQGRRRFDEPTPSVRASMADLNVLDDHRQSNERLDLFKERAGWGVWGVVDDGRDDGGVLPTSFEPAYEGRRGR